MFLEELSCICSAVILPTVLLLVLPRITGNLHTLVPDPQGISLSKAAIELFPQCINVEYT